jgi:hypothetical protein
METTAHQGPTAGGTTPEATADKKVTVVGDDGTVTVGRAVPDGWQALPAGVTRKVRVNSSFLSSGGDRPPWLVVAGGRETPVKDVQFLGVPRAVSTVEAGACGGRAGGCWIETDGPLLVRK